MQQWVVFLRGINVGGNNILPMKALVALLQEIGCTNVNTYIQSGNVVLDSPLRKVEQLSAKIAQAIYTRFLFTPKIFSLRSQQLLSAFEENPFPEGVQDPKTLHFFFFGAVPQTIEHDKLDAVKTDSERYQIIENVLYLYAPEGIGKSKLAARVEKCVGVPVTARNFRTISKVLQLAEVHSK